MVVQRRQKCQHIFTNVRHIASQGFTPHYHKGHAISVCVNSYKCNARVSVVCVNPYKCSNCVKGMYIILPLTMWVKGRFGLPLWGCIPTCNIQQPLGNEFSLVRHQEIIFRQVHKIIESVDSISRDGPDTPIYVIHYKKPKISEQESLWKF